MKALGLLVVLHHVMILLLIVRNFPTKLATTEKIGQKCVVWRLLVPVEVADKVAVRQRPEKGTATGRFFHEELQKEARDPSGDLLNSVWILNVNRSTIFA